jgi:dihydrolipoamide dehydrogenase
MAHIDFITQVHNSTKRDYVGRVTEHDKATCAEAACQFGKDYWDGERHTGYGGYKYDGRWRPIAEAMAKHYDLAPDARILDVGCGKGFLLYEFTQVLPDAKVTGIDKSGAGFVVAIERAGKIERHEYDQVLIAVGRRPNSDRLGLENTSVVVGDGLRIETNAECRTAVPQIFAIGDVTAGPMLAHKASREGKVAAEVIAGHKSAFDNRAIPAVVFTDPEIAWTGLTEAEVGEQGLAVNIGRFPLRALGRARTLGRDEGLVKVISAADTGLVLGVGMVGPHAGELIAEATLAVEMGATIEDLMVTIHPHPTLSEAIMEAAEVAAGTSVHLPRPRTRS